MAATQNWEYAVPVNREVCPAFHMTSRAVSLKNVTFLMGLNMISDPVALNRTMMSPVKRIIRMRKHSDSLKARDANHSPTKKMEILDLMSVEITPAIPKVLPKILATTWHQDRCWDG